MKLLLDEMFPRHLANDLAAAGHDVISIHDTPLAGAPDEVVLDWARANHRVIVTENVRDYRPLAEHHLASGQHHPGLVFTTSHRWPRNDPGAILNALDALLTNQNTETTDTEIWL